MGQQGIAIGAEHTRVVGGCPCGGGATGFVAARCSNPRTGSCGRNAGLLLLRAQEMMKPERLAGMMEARGDDFCLIKVGVMREPGRLADDNREDGLLRILRLR
jgi:hypothetical protein